MRPQSTHHTRTHIILALNPSIQNDHIRFVQRTHTYAYNVRSFLCELNEFVRKYFRELYEAKKSLASDNLAFISLYFPSCSFVVKKKRKKVHLERE